jgi:hypothetical protein
MIEAPSMERNPAILGLWKMKRFRVVCCILMLLAHQGAGSLAHADEVTEACDYVLRQTSAFEGGFYGQASDTFENGGKVYRGCLVSVVGDRNKVPGGFPPTDKLYPKPGSAAANAGWKADREADGQDETSYRIWRGNVFCLVNGYWEGGDKSDPSGTTSPLFLITAQCARTRDGR